MPRGSKPGERRGGRSKGTPNKVTGEVKAMLLQALANKGGVSYFESVAEDNPTAFCALIGKVIPLQVAGDASNPVRLVIQWEK